MFEFLIKNVDENITCTKKLHKWTVGGIWGMGGTVIGTNALPDIDLYCKHCKQRREVYYYTFEKDGHRHPWKPLKRMMREHNELRNYPYYPPTPPLTDQQRQDLIARLKAYRAERGY